MDQRIYSQRMNVAGCVEELRQHFLAQGYETQVLGTAPDVLFQARRRGALRSATGTANEMTARFKKSGDGIAVTLGAQQWIDKAAVGAVGALVFVPLLVTAAYGAWKQSRLPDQFWEIVEKYASACPKCGSPSDGSVFCPECGIALM